MGFAFPVPQTATRNFTNEPGENSTPDDMVESFRQRYERAARTAARAGVGDTDAARRYLRYWQQRFVFGEQYMAFVLTMRAAAVNRVNGDRAKALEQLVEAEQQAREAIETFADIARNRCDIGAVAVMAQYTVRDVAEMRGLYERDELVIE